METESHDAYPPAEIARRVERIGVAKARTDTITLLALAVHDDERFRRGLSPVNRDRVR